MSLTDLKVDLASLNGHPVEVAGNLVLIGGTAALRSGANDTSPVFLDTNALPRKQRRTLIEHYGMPGCDVRVRGIAGKVMAQPGVFADSVEFR